jgi:hypothetical protein
MKTVQEVLKQSKLPKDYPPTMMDVKMRDKHIPQSVDYNVEHFRDHGESVVKQLEKLKQTNPEKAKKLAIKACEAVQKVYKDIEKYKKG